MWYEDFDNVTTLGAALVDAGVSAGQLQEYYQKSWNWSDEWDALQIGPEVLRQVLDGEDLHEIVEKLSA